MKFNKMENILNYVLNIILMHVTFLMTGQSILKGIKNYENDNRANAIN